MKKLITFIVGAVVGLGAYAQDFDSGGLSYSVLSPDDKTCAVTGYNELESELEIPPTVIYEGEEYTVTEIGHGAFRYADINKVLLPSTLESIGNEAFFNINPLREVVIPNSVKEIGNYSFAYCFSLKRVVLGSSVEVINSCAFNECPLNVVEALGETPAQFEYGYQNAITSNPLVAVSDELIATYKAAWEGANVVPNIPAESVSFDPANYSVQVGNTVQLNCVVYPENAPVKFSTWNTDVISVDENGLVTVDPLKGNYTVYVTATSLNGLIATCNIYTESLGEFESDGFVFTVIPNVENEVAITRYNSTNAVVTIPENVEYNGNLYSVTTIGPNVFNWKEYVEEVVIPASVKEIRNDNFRYCSSMKKVTIADSETALELSDYNFTDLDNLVEIYVGRNLTCSENCVCFYWDYNISNIVLGPEVTSLPDYIFNQCNNLSFIQSMNPEPPVLGENPFVYRGNLSIVVPAESVEAYKLAWVQYESLIKPAVEAESISLETDELTIYNGQYIQLPINVEPEGAIVIWTSSNKNLVSVDKEGYISYDRWTSGVGEAVITASTLNGLTAECKVIAKHWLTFSEDNVSITPGATYQVEVTKPDELAESPISWSTSDEKIVTVDENGLITAIGCGYAEILANVTVPGFEEPFTYYIQIEVLNQPTAVTAEESIIYVWEGEADAVLINLNFEPQDDPNLNRKMTWTVADPEIAEVFAYDDTNYAVRGLKGGTTTITGETVNGLSVEIEVKVKVLLDQIIFPTEKLYIAPGQTRKLEFTTVPEETNQQFTYTSRNEEIVTIDEDGIITAHNLGTTQIGILYSTPWGSTNVWWYQVEVCNFPESVKFAGSSDYVGSLNSWTYFQLEFTPDNEDICRHIDWTADDPEIVFIDSYNRFIGRSLGTTAFRGVAVNGDILEGTITIEGIQILVNGEAISNKEVELNSEFKLEINASSAELLQNVTYSTSNPEVAIVSEDGTVTAVGLGKATIYVESLVAGDEGSRSYSAAINVVVRPSEGIIFDQKEVTLSPNRSAYLSIIRAENEEWGDITWESSDENVVKIDWSNPEEARIVYVGPGSATITATSENGFVATCDVRCIANIDEFIFNTNKIYVTPEGTFQLEYSTVPEETGQTIRFESGDEAIATVDPETGLVTGVSYGETYIYAVSENGRRWSVPVQVCIFPESVKFIGSTDYEGQMTGWTWFQIEFTPDNPDVCKHIDWTAEDPTIVEIDSNDNSFIGLNFGTTPFRGVAVNGDVLEGTITINGLKIVVDGETTRWTEISVGDQLNLDIEASSENLLENVTYSSDNTEVVTVNETGTVTAVGCGRTYVRARTFVEVGENEWKNYETYVEINVKPSEGIAFNKQNVTLTSGSTERITVYRANNVDWSSLTWESSDENVVVIGWYNTYEAQLNYVGQGTATVTATDAFGNVATCEVLCVGNIEEIVFNTKKIYLAPESTFQLEYTVVPDNTGQTIRFESGNEAVATVDPETGLVTGVDYGDTYIYAIASNGRWWSVPVKVCNLPESVKFVGDTNYEGAVNQWTYFDIEFTPNDDDICREIQWTAEDPELMYFDNSANAFYGQKLGTTAIKGVAANGDVLEGTITIGGIEILVNGEISKYNTVSLGTELKLDIKASSEELRENVTFNSYNPEVVTVTEDGIATAVGVGSTWVSAESRVQVNEEETKTYYYEIKITVRPDEGIGFNTNKLTLTPNDWTYLSIIRADNVEWSEVNWESSDENVVAITWSNGNDAELSYRGPGEATVTATDAFGNVATCEVTCYGIVINPSEVNMFTNSTYQLEITTFPETENIEPIQWTSNDPEFVSVDENGLLTTNDVIGLTYVYAYTTINGYYVEAACEVRVSEFIPVTEITLNETALSAEEGTEVQLVATVNPDDASIQTLRWESSNEAVATVDENGLVTILSVGNAVITVYATDGSGVSASCTIFGTSGVEGLLNDEAICDIYDMNGILVKKDATAEDYKQLDRGIYLIKKGDKVIKVKH